MALERDDVPASLCINVDVSTETPEHPFRMVTRGFPLDHDRFAGRVEPCEEDGGLHLSGRNRHGVVDRYRILRARDRHRQPSARLANGPRSEID